MAHERHIGFLCFDGVVALDITGPAEAFSTACQLATQVQTPHYKISLVGVYPEGDAVGPGGGLRPLSGEYGLGLVPAQTLESVGDLDTLIVPGGAGLREPATQAAVSDWIRARAPHIRRIASVCTGIYGLAPTGLLDGRRATTHWRFSRDVEAKFANIQMEDDAIFIKDGPIYTSAGATAGIDLALGLIEEDLGAQAALRVARELVVYVKRSGGQRQYSEPLSFQTRSTDPFSELVAWIYAHLNRKLSVPELAQRMCLSPRQFSRRFVEALGCPPAAFVETARLEQACQRLTHTAEPIETIADSVGFKSADVFRRAYIRKFGVSPSRYRDHFSSG